MRAIQLLVLLMAGFASTISYGQASAVAPVYGGFGPGLLDYQGTVGPAKIGLTFVIDTSAVPHGAYFYFKYLKDIPLKGSFAPDGFVLNEYDQSGKASGTFHLKISSEGGDAKAEKPLNLGNTSMLTGTWTSADGSRSLPVSLKQVGWTSGSEGHRYGVFGSDADMERKIQGFYSDVQHGNKQAAAALVSYPLRVNSLKLTVKDQRQFLVDYERVFTPDFVRCLQQYPPHNLFVNAQGIMLGQGELWFDEHGLTSVNPCSSAQH
jgi:hypothetical protein